MFLHIYSCKSYQNQLVIFTANQVTGFFVSCKNTKSIQLNENFRRNGLKVEFNPLGTNPTKWSNALKQFVRNLLTICLSVFKHFVRLALKGLNSFCKNLFPTFCVITEKLFHTVLYSFWTDHLRNILYPKIMIIIF